MFIAHRGINNDQVKENSIESFKLALDDNKYIGFECDVRETLDKNFVISHDAIYKNKIIKHTSKEELVNLGITTLEKVLALNTSKLILLEIKDFNMNLEKLSILLNSCKKNIYVMSFSKEVIKKIRKYATNFKCGILNYLFNSETNYNNYDFICLLNSVITSDIIRYFSKRNIIIFSYGIINIEKIHPNLYYIVDNNANYMLKY